MNSLAIINEYIVDFEKALVEKGDEEFYMELVSRAIKSADGTYSPEILMMSMSDKFFTMYKASANDIYYRLGKIFRRAANKVYRFYLYSKPGYEKNNKFLNVIK